MSKQQINFRVSDVCHEFIEEYRKKYYLKNKTDAIEKIILTVKRIETEEESELQLLKILRKELHDLSFAIHNADKNSDISLLMLNHLASAHDLKNLTEKQMNHIIRAKEIIQERIAYAKQIKDSSFIQNTKY